MLAGTMPLFAGAKKNISININSKAGFIISLFFAKDNGYYLSNNENLPLVPRLYLIH